MKKFLTQVGKFLGYPLKMSLGLAVVVVLLSGLLTARVIRYYPETIGLLKGAEILRQEEEAFIAEVGRSIALPTDEKPTVATVTDPTKLGEQAFFRTAEEGDKVLIYTNAKKVVLYRPSERRVVEVGTVNINNQKEGSTSVPAGAKIGLLNGTGRSEDSAAMETKLRGLIADVQIVARSSAVKSDYAKTVIVDVTGNKSEEAQAIAAKLGVEVTAMPEGEQAPAGAEFVIVVGAE